MAILFLDTSALVKYYVTEPGSTWIRQLIDGRDSDTSFLHVIFVAEITRVEVAAGISIIERIGRIHKAQKRREYDRFVSDLLHRYAVIPLKSAILRSAAELTQRHPLKAYDAVQLAVALWQERALKSRGLSLVFVCGDKTLLTAANAEGLAIENPFNHLSSGDTIIWP